MPLISDKSQKEKLKKYNINIKTKYIVGNKILERNTDDSSNDNIEKGVRCKKEYYINNVEKHVETKFDTRIEYSFITSDKLDETYTCPNCGNVDKLKSFVDGCPYCGTYYNIDYTDKDLGGKYHYDRVLRSTKYRVVTAIIDLIISVIAAYFFIKHTSRTFNSYDISKVFIYGGVLALVLYYFFYILDAYVILGPIKAYKDKLNQKQAAFWKRTGIDKKKFYNNFNYEVRNKYYSTDDIVDFDVIDFDDFCEFTKDNILHVKVKAYVRIVKFINGSFVSKFYDEEYIFKKVADATLELKDGENIMRCPNCNASIDATKGECSYCKTKIKALGEWILVK